MTSSEVATPGKSKTATIASSRALGNSTMASSEFTTPGKAKRVVPASSRTMKNPKKTPLKFTTPGKAKWDDPTSSRSLPRIAPSRFNTPGISKRVRFASSHTSIPIPAVEFRSTPAGPRERAQALRSRETTPHKKARPGAGPCSPSPAMKRYLGKKRRLVESGAVRVQLSRHTNPRRGTKHSSGRLVDQGAVRLNVTRHTTPRRLYATRSRIWSPPPSSVRKKASQSERMPRQRPCDWITVPTLDTPSRFDATPASSKLSRVEATPTPSKQRSNALIGGHRFRACISPGYMEPLREIDVNGANGDNLRSCLNRSLSRTLFD